MVKNTEPFPELIDYEGERKCRIKGLEKGIQYFCDRRRNIENDREAEAFSDQLERKYGVRCTNVSTTPIMAMVRFARCHDEKQVAVVHKLLVAAIKNRRDPVNNRPFKGRHGVTLAVADRILDKARKA